MRSIINFIPNLLTLINLTFGLIGVVLAFHAQLAWAGVFVFIAAVFDFADGFAARMLNAQSELGKQLDSLADSVTFGVLPGIIAYQMLNGIQGVYFTPFLERSLTEHAISFTGFLLTACATLRLAKFNIDTRQTIGFIGVPTPAMAMFVASIPIIAEWQYEYNIYVHLDAAALKNLALAYRYDSFDMAVIQLFSSTGFWIGVNVIFAYLMVSPLPILAMKIKTLTWQENKWRYIFLISVALTALVCFAGNLVYISFLPWLQWLFLPLIVVELIAVSVIKLLVDKEST